MFAFSALKNFDLRHCTPDRKQLARSLTPPELRYSAPKFQTENLIAPGRSRNAIDLDGSCCFSSLSSVNKARCHRAQSFYIFLASN